MTGDSDLRAPRWVANRWLAPALMLAVCFVLFVWPVGMMLIGAVRGDPYDSSRPWSTEAIFAVYSDPTTLEVFRTSLAFSLIIAVTSTAAGLYFAWLAARTDTPLRGVLTPVMLCVLTFPHLYYAISWALVGDKTIGVVNVTARQWLGVSDHVLNVSTFGGLVFVSVLKLTPVAFFLLYGPMRGIDRSQEEAAAVSGARGLRTFFLVNVKGVAPAALAVLAVCVVIGLEYFDIPLILGTPDGVDVYATEIYRRLEHEVPPGYGEASALALSLVAVVALLLAAQYWLTRGRDYATVSSKSSNTAPWPLGRAKAIGVAAIGGYLVVALLVPLASLFWTARQPYTGAQTSGSFDNFRTVLDSPRMREAILNTLELAVLGGLAAVLVCLGIAYVARHHPGRMSRLGSASTWLPWSVPGTALVLGLLWAYMSVPPLRVLYGTKLLLLLGLVVVVAPVVMRAVEGSMVQVPIQLEEAAWVFGRRRGRSFVSVVVPLILPALFGGFLLAAVIISGNLAFPLMLSAPTEQTIPRVAFTLYENGQGTVSAALFCVFLAILMIIYIVALVLRRLLGWLWRRYRANAQTPVGPPGATEPPDLAADCPDQATGNTGLSGAPANVGAVR